ncbi:acetylglutamate kinase [Alteromonas halophila]|uniref:Acetylglutamate kinase n=1 Tax=Alteromonas halophila TaxID=516698 RepID=A0A918MXF4_9ALTE|nr:acetylglutamate kinase [Alteromonas halophila]GGW78953.1 acetylglutamate kinase [Alteromonas halophila]
MSRAPVVIKVGGALLEHPEAMAHLFASIAHIQTTRPVVLVHGGGPSVEQLMQALNLPSTKIDGLRVTPDEHMPYIGGALAGHVNKALCGQALSNKLTPVGLSLLDGNMVHCAPLDAKYGAVGRAQPGEPGLLLSILSQTMLPVISSIGADDTGRLLNINADQAAMVIAQLVGGDLLLLSNVEGVLDADKMLLTDLDEQTLATLYDNGVVTDGMRVKTDAALTAALALKRPVSIASWSASISAILHHETGTRIHPNALPNGERP